MPAIQLARLKLQAAHLRDSFSRPQVFARGLRAMLDFYADRTHRQGQSGEPPPLISAYHVPTPVLRQILLELTPLISSDPEGALNLCDTLWAQSNLECRMLAASILGNLPTSHLDEILKRVQVWANEEKDSKLLDTLFHTSLLRYRRESTLAFLEQVEKWLNSEYIHEKRLGLIALQSLLDELPLETLPTLFRLLSGLVYAVPTALRQDLLAVLRKMARLSPSETAFYLHQSLDSPNSLNTARLIRQLLPDFPQEIRSELHRALREAGK